MRDKGYVLQLQSFSVNDGEGIRTVIFLPGCPLRCRWCANPETWTAPPKLAVYHSKCTGCGACEKACPKSLSPPRLDSLQAAGCLVCGECAHVCPSGALKVLIREMRVEEIVRRVEREAVFFRNSGGGVTFSGGEPTFQAEFLRALAYEFDKRGIGMWMETCGLFTWDDMADVIERLDHVLFDLKHMDPAVHKELTGVSNARILENCTRIAAMGKPFTIRVPVIRGVNGTRENIEETARFVRNLPGALPGASVELLPYHDLGREKYRAVGLGEYAYDAYAAPDAAEMEEFERVFSDRGVPVVRYR